MNKRHFILSMFLLLALVATYLLLPYGISFGIKKYLVSVGAERVDVEKVSIDLLDGQLTIGGFQLFVQNRSLIRVKNVSAQIDWVSLWNRRFLLKNFSMEGVALLIERQADGTILSGLVFPVGESAKSDAVPWEFGLKRIVLSDLEITYKEPAGKITTTINTFRLTDFMTWRPNSPTKVYIAGSVNEALFSTDVKVMPLAKEPSLNGNIKLAEFSLASIAFATPPDFPKIDGRLSFDVIVSAISLPDNTVSFSKHGSIKLEAVQVADDAINIAGADIDWDGDLSLNMSNGEDRPDINVNGTLTVDGLTVRFADGDKKVEVGEISAKSNLVVALLGENLDISSDGSLSAGNVQIKSVDTDVATDSFLWDGKVKFDSRDGTAAPDVNVDGALTVDGLTVRFAGGDKKVEVDEISAKSNLVVALSGENLDLSSDGNLSTGSVQIKSGETDVATDNFSWDGKVKFDYRDGTAGWVVVKGKGSLGETEVNVAGAKPVRANIQGLLIGGLHLDKNGAVNVETVGIDRLSAGKWLVDPDKTDVSDKNELSVRLVEIDKVSFAPGKSIAIGRLAINSLRTSVSRNSDSSFTLPLTETAKEKEKGEPKEKSKFGIRVGILLIDGDSSVGFVDATVEPAYKGTLKIEELKVRNIDTSNPNGPTDLKFNGKINDYTTVALQGWIKPFIPNLAMDITGNLKSLELPPLSPYAVNAIGYNIASGHLSSDFGIKIIDNKIAGESKIVINKLDITSKDEKRAKIFSAGLTMPLDVALSTLRDGDDNITLELSVSGDKSNPKFNLTDVLNTAFVSAMKTGAISYLKYLFQPYGTMITVAKIVGEEVMKIRLDPVLFSAGSADINIEVKEYVKRVGSLLQDRPDVQIKLCGVAVADDRPYLAVTKEQAVKPDSKQAKPAENDPSAKKEAQLVADDTLKELARSRAVNIKDYLVNRYGIDAERLFICLPRIDEKSGKKPYLELLI